VNGTASVPFLLWPKVRSVLPHGGGRRFAVRAALFVPPGLALAAGVFAASAWFLRQVAALEIVGPLLAGRLVDLALVVLQSVLVMSNLIAALSTFLLAADLELLVAAPILPGRLFAARFVESTVQASWMVTLFGFPVFLGFGVATRAGAPFYAALAASFLPFVVIPAAVGTAFSLLVVWVFPARRAREVVVAAALVGFVLLYLSFRFLEPEKLLNPEGYASMLELVRGLRVPSAPLLPSHWLSAILGAHLQIAADPAAAAALGDAAPRAPLWLYHAALWTTAAAAIVLVWWLHRAVFATAYSRAHEGRGRRGAPAAGLDVPGKAATAARAVPFDWGRALGRVFPRGLVREMWVKDLKIFTRDATQWSQLLLVGALVAVYLFNFRHFRAIGEAGLIGPLGLYNLCVALAAFVVAAIAVRFVFPQISVEGKAFWLLRAAPITPRQLLRAKVVAAVPPLLVLGEGLVAASSATLGLVVPLRVLAAATVALVTIVVAALGIGLGARFPDYRAETAAKVATSFGGVAYMVTGVVTALGLVALVAYPAYHLFWFGWTWPGGWRGAALVGTALGAAAVAALGTWLPLRIGARALERMDDDEADA
jgi:ABC-2 type transport system permease protein